MSREMSDMLQHFIEQCEKLETANKEKTQQLNELVDLLEQARSFIEYHEYETHMVLERERMPGYSLNERITSAIQEARKRR